MQPGEAQVFLRLDPGKADYVVAAGQVRKVVEQGRFTDADLATNDEHSANSVYSHGGHLGKASYLVLPPYEHQPTPRSPLDRNLRGGWYRTSFGKTREGTQRGPMEIKVESDRCWPDRTLHVSRGPGCGNQIHNEPVVGAPLGGRWFVEEAS